MIRALPALLPLALLPLALCAAALLPLGATATSARASDRFAIVVGANAGDVDERPLRYAERDAQRMAETLARFGQVPPENALVLLAPDRADLDRALTAMRGRIATATEGEDRPVVFFYYSGHADAQSIHLGGARFAFAELKRQVAALGADVAVFIVDACRSGGLLRAKGARPAEGFVIRVEDELKSTGLAIITSSSESEDAQESDRLGGGIFTHHLLTGLAGAADATRDGRVDLAEAYRYAWAATIAATSAAGVVQHPSFSFDLQGERDVLMTRIDQSRGLGRVRLAQPGHYLVFERFGTRDLAAELQARGGTELLLPPGDYLLRRREPDSVWECEARVAANAVRELRPADFARVPYRHAVRRGMTQASRQVASLAADLEVQGPVLDATSWSMLGAAGVQLDFAEVALKLRVRYGHGLAAAGPLDATQALLGVDVGVSHIFGLGDHGLGFGLRGGVDWLAQTFRARGDAPRQDQLLGRFGPTLRGELALSPTLALNVDGGVDLWVLDALREGGGSRVSLRVAPIFTLGLGVQLP
jgi:hypothetical protein